jgi:hypothetical protein
MGRSTDAYKPFFSVGMALIGKRNQKRIIEESFRFFKTHLMLGQVGTGFVGIPLEDETHICSHFDQRIPHLRGFFNIFKE